MIRRFFSIGVVAAMLAPAATPAQSAPLFDFQSSFWVNLHQFLYITARAHKGLDPDRPATKQALADTVGFANLPASQRAAWDSAVAFYTRDIADRDVLFDSALVVVNARLSRAGNAASLRGADVDTAIARELQRAAPAYRALWWPRHDRANKRWIATVQPLIAQYGDSAARWEAARFFTPWPAPLRGDVAAYATWAGGYTITDPPHMTVSSINPSNAGIAGFETLFHEALHTLDSALFDSTRAAFRAVGKRAPRNPTHPIIFYTAGEITRRLVSRDYVPFAEAAGLWKNPDFAQMLPLLRAYWQPYLDGKSTLGEALRGIASGW
jgi:hypothetical protein